MSISNAMQSAVSGLGANSKATQKVAQNVANTGTVGYKREFVDLVTTTGASGSSGSGVRAVNNADVRLEGTKMMTSSPTDLAISGEGFFLVSKNPNDPIESNYFFTRAGSFKPDENGNLVNPGGYYLAGFTPDAEGNLGAVDFTSVASVSTVNVGDRGIVAGPTTEISLAGNLPSDETGTGAPTAPFNSTMRYTNALGAVERLTISWQASEDTANLWTATVTGPVNADGTPGQAYGTVNVTFSDSGATPGAPASFAGVQDPTLVAPAAFVVNPDGTVEITIDNGQVPQTIELDLGTVGEYDGITQFAGDFSAQNFETDGNEAATIATTEFDDRGILWGVYDNGDRRALYQVPVVTVPNPDGLRLIDGNAYSLTRSSGDMVLNLSGAAGAGTIEDYSLEQSNVDIAKEMTDLIVIQRNYSSNARIITTADEMLQEATNLKR